jgi:DNA processing protein
MDRPHEQRCALVALLRQPGVRWSEVTTELLTDGDAARLLRRQFSAEPALFEDDTPMVAALREADDLIQQWQAAHIGIHTLFDDSYPTRLRDVHQMPPIVFTRGSLADDRRAVAVVGTRKPTDRGVAIATRIATALASNGVTVVSGLAAGIDTAAHRAALAAGGRTVAVIGTGVDRYYPAANRALQEQIVADGLVLSQFWPNASPTKQTFPMRNAVMSGYAAATVVVEAAYRSGARMQARLALQHGRPVVLTDSLMVHDWAREYAARPGVYVVRSDDELLSLVDEIVQHIPNVTGATEDLSPLVRL